MKKKVAHSLNSSNNHTSVLPGDSYPTPVYRSAAGIFPVSSCGILKGQVLESQDLMQLICTASLRTSLSWDRHFFHTESLRRDATITRVYLAKLTARAGEQMSSNALRTAVLQLILYIRIKGWDIRGYMKSTGGKVREVGGNKAWEIWGFG